jgi:DNA-binding response OmpR family regulator
MPGNQPTQTMISFGPFDANLQTQELRKHGLRLRLPGQSFQILKILVAKPGQLVTREELREALWPCDGIDRERAACCLAHFALNLAYQGSCAKKTRPCPFGQF